MKQHALRSLHGCSYVHLLSGYCEPELLLNDVRENSLPGSLQTAILRVVWLSRVNSVAQIGTNLYKQYLS